MPCRHSRLLMIIAIGLLVGLLASAAAQSTQAAAPSSSTGAASAPAAPATSAPAAPASATPTYATPAPAASVPATPAPAHSSAAPAATPDNAAAKLAEKRRETILYGIDSEIIDLLGSLDREKDGEFNADLLSLFTQSTNDKLRVTILGLFADLKWNGAEKTAIDLVTNRDSESTPLVYGALSYLAAIRSKQALSFSSVLVKEDNKSLLPALIDLMGRAGGAPEEAQLLSWFDSDNFDQNLREDTIKALGEIGSAKAAAKLDSIVEDDQEPMPSRVFACQSLAKIKDPVSVPSLIKAANGGDPYVRAAAVEALSHFSTPQSDAAIVQALRDSVANVRIAACKAAGSRGIASAFPFLKYKATSDPSSPVQIEAYKALAQLGGPAFSFLRSRIGDEKESYEIRALCFGLLASKDPGGSMPLLEKTLTAAAADTDRSLYTDFARAVAYATDAPQAGPLAKIFLADKDYLIRIAAVDWARNSKVTAFKPILADLAKNDPSGVIRRSAAAVLASL